MTDIYIYDAVRTPRGKGRAGGALSGCTPQALVGTLTEALEARTSPDAVRRAASLTLGCVTQFGAQGGHIALVSRLAAGLPETMRAVTLNNFCVSGLTAVAAAADEAAARRDARLRLAGGVEMMSRAPFMADQGFHYSDPETSASLGYVPVVLSADLMAAREGLTREALDAVTARSHARAARAWARGGLDEVIAVAGRDGAVILAADECVRADMTLERLSALKPAFAALGAQGYDARMLAACPELDEISHVHTLAHCPPLADAAALVLLGARDAGEAAGIRPKARIRALEQTAGDPVLQLTSGFAAMERALDAAGARLADMERIEFMEAFAAVPAKFERDYAPDPERVNPDGGHLAMGHPMGATGAILVAALLAGLERQDASTGLAVAHGGSGVGAAIIIERV